MVRRTRSPAAGPSVAPVPARPVISAGISYVFTITRVAKMIGEDEDRLQEISTEMNPEDGCLTVLGPGEEAITAFTRFGVDNLIELVDMHKANPNLLRRYTPPE